MITIYFESRCTRCVKFANLLKVLFYFNQIQYTPLLEASEDIQAFSQKHNSWIVQISKKKYIQGEAFLRLLSKTKPYWPVGKILCTWPLRWITFPFANLVYKICQPKAC